jgi:hypothetical protein
MRWTGNPRPGSKRTVIKFAWFPVGIGNHIVWLERYREGQVYSNAMDNIYAWTWNWRQFLEEKPFWEDEK